MASEQGTVKYNFVIFLLLSTCILLSDFEIIFYLRYNNTWGDWHGGTGGNLASFETVVISVNGWMNRQVKGLVFKGIDGKNYGPYGKTSGTFWETDIPLGCSVQYISGHAGGLLESISFHYNCPTTILLNTTTTEGMNTDIH